MSAGPRVPWSRASEIVRWLGDVWPGLKPGSAVVGSYRRLKPDIGDLEILLPAAAAKGHDPVYDAIAPTMRGYVPQGLHDAPPASSVGQSLRGLRPGFLEASIVVVVPKAIGGGRMPLQVYRYTPENFGWMMLMRTGPADFGRWFLWKWKRAWGLRPDQPASVHGHLVDADGRVVPVRSETYCFMAIGMSVVIPPHKREEFAAARMTGAGGGKAGSR